HAPGFELPFGATHLERRLVEDRRTDDDVAGREIEPRPVAAALDRVTNDRALGERAAGVRAGVVERVDLLAAADEHEGLPTGLRPALDGADEAGDRDPEEAEEARPRHQAGAVVEPEAGEDDRDGLDADRYVGEQRVKRMAEPRAVEEAQEPRRPDDETADRG